MGTAESQQLRYHSDGRWVEPSAKRGVMVVELGCGDGIGMTTEGGSPGAEHARVRWIIQCIASLEDRGSAASERCGRSPIAPVVLREVEQDESFLDRNSNFGNRHRRLRCVGLGGRCALMRQNICLERGESEWRERGRCGQKMEAPALIYVSALHL